MRLLFATCVSIYFPVSSLLSHFISVLLSNSWQWDQYHEGRKPCWDTECINTHKGEVPLCSSIGQSVRCWLTKLSTTEHKLWCNWKTVNMFVFCIIVEEEDKSYIEVILFSFFILFFWESNLESSLTNISVFSINSTATTTTTDLLYRPTVKPLITYCTAALNLWLYLMRTWM